MNSKNKSWDAKQHRLQIYLPSNLKKALDSYIADKLDTNSRVVSAVVRKAISEFLERAGYLQGGDK